MWSGLALFYFACLLFGFLFALIGAVFGEFGHGGVEGGHEVDVGGGGHEVDFGHAAGHEAGVGGHVIGVEGGGHAMPGTSVFNTITISTFTGFFGIGGLIAVWGFGQSALGSLAIALPAAALMAALEFLLYVKVFVKAQASSEATLAEILGCEAEVTAGIPSDRVGQIVYVIKGSRYTAHAGSADGEDIPRGARVRVVNIRGNTLMVRPL